VTSSFSMRSVDSSIFCAIITRKKKNEGGDWCSGRNRQALITKRKFYAGTRLKKKRGGAGGGSVVFDYPVRV